MTEVKDLSEREEILKFISNTGRQSQKEALMQKYEVTATELEQYESDKKLETEVGNAVREGGVMDLKDNLSGIVKDKIEE
jgi:hypothetical protein